jgi:hypothetical protein
VKCKKIVSLLLLSAILLRDREKKNANFLLVQLAITINLNLSAKKEEFLRRKEVQFRMQNNQNLAISFKSRWWCKKKLGAK